MSQERYADLVLANARVLTLDRSNPTAWFVAIKDGLILGVGTAEEVRQFTSGRTRHRCAHYRMLDPQQIAETCVQHIHSPIMRIIQMEPVVG